MVRPGDMHDTPAAPSQAPAPLALAGLRVLEAGSGAALAYAGKLFADFGAEVVKLEPRGGDVWRDMPPRVEGGGGASQSALFAWLNTNKRSAGASCADDPAAIAALARGCDVLLDARALDEGIDVLQRTLWTADGRTAPAPPVAIDFTWFGADGPYARFAGSDSVVRALSGAVHGSGPVQGPPHLPHDLHGGIVAGLAAFSAAVAAWIGRAQGSRRFVLSVHEALFGTVEMEAGMVQDGRHPLRRLGVNRFCITHPAGVYETASGWLGLFTHTQAQWGSLCDAIGRPDLAHDPAYATGADRMAHADEIDALLVPALRTRSAREWFDELRARRFPAVLVPTMQELLKQSVHRERGAFVRVGLGDAASFEAPAVPLRLGDAGPLRGGRAARGDDDPPQRPGWQRRALPPQPAPVAALPLEGVRVLDLTMGWAGPLATRTLADLGADVIKVESAGYPDWWRGMTGNEAFYRERQYEKNGNFNMMNRNKRGITLDLTHREGRRLLLSLAARCDAFIENYSADVLRKLGLGYDALRVANPRIVMLSMPAFGLGNRWSDTRAYGGTLEQASGLPLYTGHPEHPPALTSYAYGDPIGGLNAGAALLLGLLVQRESGVGRHIDLSQVEAMLPLTAPFVIEQSLTGAVGARNGNRHPIYTPHGCYRCAGEDAWIVIAATSDAAWQALALAIGRPELGADPALATAEGRRARQAEIDLAIARWCAPRPADTAMAELQAAGVAAGAVRTMTQVLSDPHLRARGFWQAVPRAHVGRYLCSTACYRQGDAPLPIRRPAPTLGEHSDEVLGSLLGLPPAKLAALARHGITGCEARAKTGGSAG
jgi:crotonobetainyl-CoA:carnitine CoA-transferase CaiB-like acyl-CoA transferase